MWAHRPRKPRIRRLSSALPAILESRGDDLTTAAQDRRQAANMRQWSDLRRRKVQIVEHPPTLRDHVPADGHRSHQTGARPATRHRGRRSTPTHPGSSPACGRPAPSGTRPDTPRPRREGARQPRPPPTKATPAPMPGVTVTEGAQPRGTVRVSSPLAPARDAEAQPRRSLRCAVNGGPSPAWTRRHPERDGSWPEGSPNRRSEPGKSAQQGRADSAAIMGGGSVDPSIENPTP